MQAFYQKDTFHPLKTTPVFSGAGKKQIVTSSPVWRPIPENEAFSLSVRCFRICSVTILLR